MSQLLDINIQKPAWIAVIGNGRLYISSVRI